MLAVVILTAGVFSILTACSKIGAWDFIRQAESHEGIGREITLEIDLSGIKWIDHGNLDSSDITDFPVLVRLDTSVDFDYPERLSSDGSDIRFFDSSGHQLAYETALWNVSGPSAWWVRIPDLDKTLSNNTITLSYDYWSEHPPIRLPEADTWSNSFIGVWHLDEADGATTFRDSSIWGNDGITGVDGMDVPVQELPPGSLGFGNARYFDSTGWANPSFRAPPPGDEGTEGELEAYSLGYWARFDAWGQMNFLEKGDIQLEYGGTGDFRSFVFRSGGNHRGDMSLDQWLSLALVGEWIYFQFTSSGILNNPPVASLRVYSNGDRKSGWTTNIKGGGDRNGNLGAPLQFCRQSSDTAKFALDEIRLSRGERSQDWAILDYANMSGVLNVTRVSEQVSQ